MTKFCYYQRWANVAQIFSGKSLVQTKSRFESGFSLDKIHFYLQKCPDRVQILFWPRKSLDLGCTILKNKNKFCRDSNLDFVWSRLFQEKFGRLLPTSSHYSMWLNEKFLGIWIHSEIEFIEKRKISILLWLEYKLSAFTSKKIQKAECRTDKANTIPSNSTCWSICHWLQEIYHGRFVDSIARNLFDCRI